MACGTDGSLQGCGTVNLYYLSTVEMVEIHLSNQYLLARKLTFFVFLEKKKTKKKKTTTTTKKKH